MSALARSTVKKLRVDQTSPVLTFPHAKRLTLSKPRLMGIINLHTDSFCAVGRCASRSEVLAHAHKLIVEGADLLDLGAEPTNPATDNQPSDPEAELALLLPVIRALRDQVDVPLSIDTSHPDVMRACIDAGADLINDVRGLSLPGAMQAVAELQVPVCLMHFGPLNSQDSNSSLMMVIKQQLRACVAACLSCGIKSEQIILDPGFGGGWFGKTTGQNVALLKDLDELVLEGYPVLAGVSRKSFIGELLEQPVTGRLAGSISAALYAVLQGAKILRVHDVRATSDALAIWQQLQWEEDNE